MQHGTWQESYGVDSMEFPRAPASFPMIVIGRMATPWVHLIFSNYGLNKGVHLSWNEPSHVLLASHFASKTR